MQNNKEKIISPHHTPPAGEGTKLLWRKSGDLIEKIFEHPFSKGLIDGTLPERAIRHYLAQDLLYIEQDARAFSLASLKALHPNHKKFFKDMARDGVEIERSLHRELLPRFNVTPSEEMSPVCRSYAHFLVDQAQNRTFEQAASALLPCFWVYHETGMHIREQAISPNSFQAWIDTYAGSDYTRYVSQFVSLVEKLYLESASETRQQMIVNFRKSTAFELDFFEEAWQQR